MKVDIDIVNKIVKLLKTSYEESKDIKEKNIKNKELNDIVTDVDIFMEKKIVYAIQAWYPDHSIDAEEGGRNNKNSEYEWLVDPIDGTVNFAAGLPLFSTSIALKRNNEIIFGIVVDYSNDDVYYAIKGEGAFCNNEPIKVSIHNELNSCLVSVVLSPDYNEAYIKKVLAVEEKLAPKIRGLRLICSSAIELCWLASGKTDGFIKVKPSKGLGSTAGKLIAQEAGGKVTNLFGNKQESNDTLLVTNGLIHNEIISTIN